MLSINAKHYNVTGYFIAEFGVVIDVISFVHLKVYRYLRCTHILNLFAKR